MKSDRRDAPRARLLSVVTIILAGAVGVVASTQTWLVVTLVAAEGDILLVPGAAAVPVLAPLSLAVLALGAALSIVGLALRWIFGVLTVLIASTLLILTVQIVVTHPVGAVAATVTTSTGITGAGAIATLISSMDSTSWPVITGVVEIALLAAGVFTLATAHRWRGSGRRYSTTSAPDSNAVTRPHDAIDSWDDLSRGDDPTNRPG